MIVDTRMLLGTFAPSAALASASASASATTHQALTHTEQKQKQKQVNKQNHTAAARRWSSGSEPGARRLFRKKELHLHGGGGGRRETPIQEKGDFVRVGATWRVTPRLTGKGQDRTRRHAGELQGHDPRAKTQKG